MTTRQYRTFLTLISYTSLVYADESIIQPRGVGLDYNVQLGRLRLGRPIEFEYNDVEDYNYDEEHTAITPAELSNILYQNDTIERAIPQSSFNQNDQKIFPKSSFHTFHINPCDRESEILSKMEFLSSKLKNIWLRKKKLVSKNKKLAIIDEERIVIIDDKLKLYLKRLNVIRKVRIASYEGTFKSLLKCKEQEEMDKFEEVIFGNLGSVLELDEGVKSIELNQKNNEKQERAPYQAPSFPTTFNRRSQHLTAVPTNAGRSLQVEQLINSMNQTESKDLEQRPEQICIEKFEKHDEIMLGKTKSSAHRKLARVIDCLVKYRQKPIKQLFKDGQNASAEKCFMKFLDAETAADQNDKQNLSIVPISLNLKKEIISCVKDPSVTWIYPFFM